MLSAAKKELRSHQNAKKALTSKGFFKHRSKDIFLGVSKPVIKQISKTYWQLDLKSVNQLAKSKVHEEQALAHAILCIKFHKGSEKEQKTIYQFYLKNRKYIRDWDGVDDSAPYLVGRYLLDKDKKILYSLAKSKHLWSRRIAIVSTWWFIRNGVLNHTLDLAEILLNDQEDLIHKASGWMLREAGKKDLAVLRKFLDKYHQTMPRTMLRYAIERLSLPERKKYMKKGA